MANLFAFGFTGKAAIQAAKKGRVESKIQYEKTNRKRDFVKKWLDEYNWVAYDETTALMTCVPCCEYRSLVYTDTTSSFITGSSVFRVDSIKSHESSSAHRSASKRYDINTLKKNNKTAICSYTGEVQSGPPADHVVLPGCPQVVGAMDRSLQKINETQKKKLAVCLNTAYWVLKNEQPFSMYPSLLNLQEINGVSLAASYKSDQACRRFVKYIYGDLMERPTSLLKNSRVMSVMFDGATDVSVCENEIVYARVVVNGIPESVYVRTQPVNHAHAEGVLEAIEKSMDAVESNWKNKLIATGSDGASVNLGKKKSVTALLKRDVPHLLPMHCVNHRLELGALDAIKDRDAKMFADIKSVLLLIHKHYLVFPPRSKRGMVKSEMRAHFNA